MAKEREKPSNITRQLLKYNRIIFILSIAGAAIALYVFQSFVREVPILCVNTGCETVRKSAYSNLLGIPVPGYGLIGYSLMTILAFIRTTSKNPKLLIGILGIATFGVLFVTWFTLTEIFLINAICTWCAVSAGIMTVIFILALKSFLLERKYHAPHQ